VKSRLESYRVQAYNTAKLSENKMHDDTVAKRFGFSGGLVPGVDVMAYMMHVPVTKWGRAFLERGLIEARFVKPVYDGETVEITGEESAGVLAIQVESRGQLCATGSASLPASAPLVPIADFRDTAPVSERKPVDARSYELGKWLGTVPRAWAGEAAKEYLTDVRERDPIYTSHGLGHPGLVQRVMNQCHPRSMDSCRQPNAAAVGGEEWRRIDRARESHRQLREEGPPLCRGGCAGRRQQPHPGGALSPHRDLPAARAGGGVGVHGSHLASPLRSNIATHLELQRYVATTARPTPPSPSRP
jgi:hypothetical protein